ncbi:MAG TPA: hypothetical protein PKJ11_00420 [bacterium]|jgi:hypothetical protein|nr:MAG: hypothetical protein BWX53_00502 [Parcubacteria group bacterium ADurb.Bin016]HNU89793.1 hypothetical protein [bacterium]HPX64611.1 hypothetical protein [bacterium]
MFEEVNNQNAAAAANTPEAQNNNPAAGQPTAESSKGEPVVQDIFANMDDKPDSNIPLNPDSSGMITKPVETNAGTQSAHQPPVKSTSKAKLVLIILIILVVVAAGVLVYSQYFKQAPTEAIIPESVVNIEENAPVNDSEAVTEPLTADIVEPEINFEEPAIIDTNFPTEEGEPIVETENGTNTGEGIMPEEPVLPEEVAVDLDSDQDGLSDADEINIYGTNPLKSDTDGDGYLDGDEVKNGYNPLGEGSLSQ